MESVHDSVESGIPATKQCSKCGATKDVGRFYKKSASSNELRSHCIECCSAINKRSWDRRHASPRGRIKSVWNGMVGRCHNENRNHYHRYGGRGIVVCDEWRNNFSAFLEWSLCNGWKPGLQIDRIDNDGPYCPENCRYVTRDVNMRNRRCQSLSGYRGVGFEKRTGRWVAYSRDSAGKTTYVGTFDTPEEAAMARDDAVRGKGYTLNFPSGVTA